MDRKIVITESTKESIKKDFGKKVNFDDIDSILALLKESKKYSLSYVGNTIKIRQVLNG